MTDIIEWLRANSSGIYRKCADAADIIEELEQQLAECQAREKVLRDALELSWSEEYVNGIVARSKARDALTLPSDSTALDTMLKQAKREALLEAANEMTHMKHGDALAPHLWLRNKAKELE